MINRGVHERPLCVNIKNPVIYICNGFIEILLSGKLRLQIGNISDRFIQELLISRH